MSLSPALLVRLRDAPWPVVALVAVAFLFFQYLRGEELADGFGLVLVLFLGTNLALVALAGWATNRE